MGPDHPTVEEQRRRWERKRCRTAQELLRTEHEYLEKLEIVTKFYDEVFRARCGNLKLAQEGICGTIPSIVTVHRSLLMSLEHNMAARGFQRFMQYLHLYKKHADCIEPTRQVLQSQTKKNKSFARFKKLQESRPEFHGQALEQLLELPLHRVQQYKHYLTDLVDNTLPGHADSVQLKDALQAVSEVCDYCQDIKHDQENDQQMKRVQRLLKGRRVRITCPGRQYIREGWLSLVPMKGEDVKHRMIFLFSDILIVTSRCHPLHPFNAQKFCCHAVYPLRECKVERVLGHTQSQGGLISLSFRREKLMLMSSDQPDMNSWYECLVAAVRKLHSNSTCNSTTENLQNLRQEKTARAPKRQHMEVGVQEETSAKRMKSFHCPEEQTEPPPSDASSGWRCLIL